MTKVSRINKFYLTYCHIFIHYHLANTHLIFKSTVLLLLFDILWCILNITECGVKQLQINQSIDSDYTPGCPGLFGM